MSPISADFAPKIGCHGNAWQRPLTDPKTNTRLNTYTNISTIPENLVKIGLVVSEIPLLQAIVKIRKKKVAEAKHKPGGLSLAG